MQRVDDRLKPGPDDVGAQRALDAGFTEIEVVVSASDTHNRKNLNRSTEESLDDIAAIQRLYGANVVNTRIGGTNFTVGLVLGLLQFVSTFTIATIYVRFANKNLDDVFHAVFA